MSKRLGAFFSSKLQKVDGLRPLCVGIRSEIAHCEWLDGRPKQGHLQEAARDMR